MRDPAMLAYAEQVLRDAQYQLLKIVATSDKCAPEVCAASGLRQQRICDIIFGRSDPTIRDISNICFAYGITPHFAVTERRP